VKFTILLERKTQRRNHWENGKEENMNFRDFCKKNVEKPDEEAEAKAAEAKAAEDKAAEDKAAEEAAAAAKAAEEAED
jgi:hypothetical protein